jgi:hypothetical protein
MTFGSCRHSFPCEGDFAFLLIGAALSRCGSEAMHQFDQQLLIGIS